MHIKLTLRPTVARAHMDGFKTKKLQHPNKTMGENSLELGMNS